jgi:hypothetical protein
MKMVLKELEYEGVDWVSLELARAQWRILVKTVMNIRVP